jgi:dihydroflavonol-4-reductase
MTILITGATGFLGSHLCRRLASAGHTVTILRRSASNVDALAGLELRHEIGEITDPLSVERATRSQQVVIHAAACLAPNKTRAVQYAVNVQGTKNVVRACIRSGVSRLLHVSSVAAIGIPEDGRPANEDFRFNLEQSGFDYQISKYQAESAVAEGVSCGLDAIVVNPAWIWGPSGLSYRGAELVETVRQKHFLRCSSGGVCTVHVQDVVDGILAALERGSTGNRYILGGENLTFRQLMEKIATAIGAAPWLVPVPAPAIKWAAGITRASGRILGGWLSTAHAKCFYASHFCHYDWSKAHFQLGYRPRAFDKILQECLSYTP